MSFVFLSIMVAHTSQWTFHDVNATVPFFDRFNPWTQCELELSCFWVSNCSEKCDCALYGSFKANGLITLYCAIRSGPGRWNLSELIQSLFCMVGLLCHSEFSLILEGMLWENSFTNMGGKSRGLVPHHLTSLTYGVVFTSWILFTVQLCDGFS
jgi:hypothetical protein